MRRHTSSRAGAPRRRRRALWLTLLALPLALLIDFSARVAFADPSPGPGPTPGASASPQPGQSAPATPAPSAPASPGTSAPSAPAPPPATSAPAPQPPSSENGNRSRIPKQSDDEITKPAEEGSGLLSPFDVNDENGVPISSYGVDADTGGWKDIDLKIWNLIAQIFFSIAKWVVGFACWLIDWALNFGLAKILVGPVDDIATTLKTQVIDRLGLPGMFLLFAGLYAGWHILFRQRSRGFAEAGLSLVIAALTTTVLVSPAQVLLGQHDRPTPQGSTMLLSEDGLLGKAKGMSLEVSGIILNKDDDGGTKPENVSKPITNALVDALIVKPNQLMLYGRTFDGACAKAFGKYKLAEYNLSRFGLNYWEATTFDFTVSEEVRARLKSIGENFIKTCNKDGKTKLQSRRASADMAFSALFIAIAALIVCILMVLVTGGFLTAQGWLAFEGVRGHWALCAGILPGGGRATFYRWLAAMAKAVLRVLLSIFFLAFFVLVILALIHADTGDVLAVKFMAIDFAAIAGLAGHKRIAATAQQVAVNLNRRLANARVGGTGRSIFNSPGRYAETAPGLKQLWGEARGEARKAAAPLKTAKDLWTGSPQAASKARSKLRMAARAAAAAGTGGAAAAAQAAARQTLKNRLSAAAKNKMAGTRGGRATMATGKAALATAKFGAKATKFTALATVGAPVGIPRGVAATKRGAQATAQRATAVKDQLVAVKDRKVSEAKAFATEYKTNVATMGRFVGRHATNAQLGLAQPLAPQPPQTTPGPRAAATAPAVPGGTPLPPSPPPATTPAPPVLPTPQLAAAPANPPLSGPAVVPAIPAPSAGSPTPPPAPAPSAAPPATPATPGRGPRGPRRATRPAGPPSARP
ncbi:hypothetical protein [Streptomyces aureoversilis]|uniref:Integral membrane protein n=1 Tax=Streptomyces aureoversilis TaxID=67277 RepID=A0ABW0A7K6_9ACTN